MIERLGILISGGGTTMNEIIKAQQNQEISNVEIACIIASRYEAGGIEKAKKLGIPEEDIIVINPNDFRDKVNRKIDQNSFGKKIINELKKRGVSFVTQNGWMPLTPENVIKEFESRIFNQHPAPVPEFGGKGMYGRRPHQAIIEFSRLTNRVNLWTEVIGQEVNIDYDAGVVVSSKRVDFSLTDDGDSLQKRALPVEHRVQIEMIKKFALGSLKKIYRKESIVLAGQENYLKKAKEIAIKKYPNG